jgi:arylsulfatase A-like enzyme
LALLLASLTVAVPPGVVSIGADDLGWADRDCYGSTFHQSPHFERLAAGGVRFTDGDAAAPD